MEEHIAILLFTYTLSKVSQFHIVSTNTFVIVSTNT